NMPNVFDNQPPSLLFPNARSPASPNPGTIKAFSSSRSSREAVQSLAAAGATLRTCATPSGAAIADAICNAFGGPVSNANLIAAQIDEPVANMGSTTTTV